MANKTTKTHHHNRPAVAAAPRKQPTVAKKKVDNGKALNIALGLTALLTFIAFCLAINNEFVNWDDSGYVLENRMIMGLDGAHLKRIFSEFVEGNYHPITMLSLAIDYHFSSIMPDGKISPFTFHLMNVLFHTANAVLVTLFIFRITNNAVIAGIAGILFGVHPMHVESVAWASERKDVLHAFFYLLALLCYTRFLKQEAGKIKYYVLAILLFILACLSKGQAVSLTLVLFLVDYYKGREFNKKLFTEKIPFFIISIAFGIVAIVAQHHTNAIQDSKVFSTFERVQFASYGLLSYLFKLFIPVKLSNFYPYPVKTLGQPMPFDYYIYPLLVIGLGFLVYKAYKSGKNKDFIFGFGFFIVTIAMMLQLMAVGSAIMADRYSYIAYIGVFFIIGAYYERWKKEKPGYKTILSGGLGLYTVIMIGMSMGRCDVWQNSFNLWSDCISKYKTAPVAYNNLGLVYKEQKNYDKALQNYNEAASVDPSYQATYENRGNIFFLTNKYDLAIKDLRKAMELKPNSEVAFNSYGAVFFNMGQYDTALVAFDKAIKFKSDYPEAYRNRGNVYSVKGQFEKALDDYNTYIGFDPRFPLTYFWRGLAEFNLKRYDAAAQDYTTALGFQPGNAEWMYNRARAYEMLNNIPAALQDATTAKSMGANVPESYIQGLQAKAH